MKVILTFSLLLFFHLLSAQQDSVYMTQQIVEADEYRQGKQYKYIDHSLLERKTLFKLILPVQTIGSAAREGLSIEHKVWPSFSLELGGYVPRFGENAVFSSARYYPGKRKGAKNTRHKINNFTGNHFYASVAQGFSTREDIMYFSGFGDELMFQVGYGRQQKLGKWGFFNVGVGLQYFPERGTMSLGFDVQPGFAFGKSHDPHPSYSKYEGFKNEYSSESTIFRLSDLSLFMWNISEGNRFEGSISFSVEQKISQNFSILAIANTSLSRQEHKRNNGTVTADRRVASLNLQSRYYYNLKKRLRKGANPRSFSGHYITALINNFYATGHSESVYLSERRIRRISGFDRLDIGLGWGIQERFGRRGFLDVNMALLYETTDKELIGTGTQGLTVYSSASVGITLGK